MKQLLICPLCGSEAVLVDSRIIYGTSYGRAWACPSFPACDHHVGAHRYTNAPLGTLADAATRAARKEAHAAFDPLWRLRRMGRNAAYRMLARWLQLSAVETHIGLFDVAMCRRVVEVCAARTKGG